MKPHQPDDETGPATPAPSAPDTAVLAREMHFDLIVAKMSLLLDLTSHILVFVFAPPSVVIFTAVTSLSSMGAGLLPAAHSLALCIMQARGDVADVGRLFGALSVLQAVGSTILGVSARLSYFICSLVVLADHIWYTFQLQREDCP